MSIVRRRRRGRWVDPDLFGESLGLGGSADEASRVLRPCRAQRALALLEDALSPTVMDILEGEHRDSGMTVLGVVPGEERPAKLDRGGDIGKRPGKPEWYFRVLNWASEKGLSSLTWGWLSERVTPRSASSCAVHLLVMGAPRSECKVVGNK